MTGIGTTGESDTESLTRVESGTDAGGDPYTITENDSSTLVAVDDFDTFAGTSTQTTTNASTSTLGEAGSDATGTYSLTETVSDGDTLVENDDDLTGDYTSTDTSTASTVTEETNAHTGGSTSYTESIGIAGTAFETGNRETDDYTRTTTETTTTGLVESDSETTGTVTVSQNDVAGSTAVEGGNYLSGDYTATTSATHTYTMTESGTQSPATFALTEMGTNASTGVKSGNTIAGTSTDAETGTDSYSLIETGTNAGGAFSQTVQGTDGWTLSETEDTLAETFGETETGGGSYTEVDRGAGATKSSGSGTTGFTLTEGGNWRAGEVSQSETGTDRYALLEQFVNVASSSNGQAGHLDFSPTGGAFNDPEPKKDSDSFKSIRIIDEKSGVYGYLKADSRYAFDGQKGMMIWYSGTNPEKVHFFQMINVTITAETKEGTSVVTRDIGGVYTNTGGNVISLGKWEVDHVATLKLPWYSDTPKIAGKNEDESWMFDHPHSRPLINKFSPKGARKTTVAANFITYMVVEGKIVGQVSWMYYTTWKDGLVWGNWNESYGYLKVSTEINAKAAEHFKKLEGLEAKYVSQRMREAEDSLLRMSRPGR